MTDTLWLVLEFLAFGFAIGGVVWLAEIFKDTKR
jgi:hypothetical protein